MNKFKKGDFAIPFGTNFRNGYSEILDIINDQYIIQFHSSIINKVDSSRKFKFNIIDFDKSCRLPNKEEKAELL